MPGVEALDRYAQGLQTMPQPDGQRPSFHPDPGGGRRTLLQDFGDRLWARGALATPQAATLSIHHADLGLLLRHIQADVEWHCVLHKDPTKPEPTPYPDAIRPCGS